ncbi:MarR family transcriptional regulator [Ketobacter sp. MCCC 1A13808]|uniref:MarR family winged helix-turn-helix transcriptional regulator n=1 Tax=Ketobacter sp. MCCC 1A13808 TaxID=2602738 RepID=UPI0012EB28A4|nr:helix-turn-helix domain-containing protein [Ketobacter sp. MCCC 1A13808]MVF12158.1 MarR family transcriptional regulator [Ketobacter sp. MCCC 1A13808]
MRNDEKVHHPVIALIDEVIRVNSRLRSVFEGTTDASGLNSMQLTVLTAVVESRMPPTVPQIGRSLGHPRQVINRATKILLEQGLIEALDNPDHKRAPLLIATDTGKQLKMKVDATAEAAADALLTTIDAATFRKLTKDLQTLRASIEAHTRGSKNRS